MDNLMQKIESLAKRRGFIYPGSDIYGGLANSWDFGPLGVALKNNIRQEWWKWFVESREDVFGIDPAVIMNTKVWESSGHLKEFSDPLVEDKKTNERYRLDHLLEKEGINVSEMSEQDMVEKAQDTNLKSPKGNELAQPKQFNLMFKTNLGPIENDDSTVYLRPEIAQAMFVNFKNVFTTMRARLPFGIAACGKAFRDEITPGNYIYRTREFDLMEFEYFVQEKEWEKHFKFFFFIPQCSSHLCIFPSQYLKCFFHSFFLKKLLKLHKVNLPGSIDIISWSNFIAKRFTASGNAKWKASSHRSKNVFKINKHGLSNFWPQINCAVIVLYRAQVCFKHQIELFRLS